MVGTHLWYTFPLEGSQGLQEVLDQALFVGLESMEGLACRIGCSEVAKALIVNLIMLRATIPQ